MGDLPKEPVKGLQSSLLEEAQEKFQNSTLEDLPYLLPEPASATPTRRAILQWPPTLP